MRSTLPAALAAAILVAGAVPPAAARAHRRKPPARITSHISLHVSSHAVVGRRRLLVRGRVRPGGTRRVKIVVRGPRGAAVGTTSGRTGAFALRWRPAGPGSYRIRAYARHTWAMRASASTARRITAFRTVVSSYYGPGLYGGALACGGTLQPGTLGVASKTLPCGSEVKLRYRGHTVTVPVVDRGPYVAGRDYDLTAATRARLRFPSTGMLLSNR
jgi:peptidoglycan lytic transglycosylase